MKLGVITGRIPPCDEQDGIRVSTIVTSGDRLKSPTVVTHVMSHEGQFQRDGPRLQTVGNVVSSPQDHLLHEMLLSGVDGHVPGMHVQLLKSGHEVPEGLNAVPGTLLTCTNDVTNA